MVKDYRPMADDNRPMADCEKTSRLIGFADVLPMIGSPLASRYTAQLHIFAYKNITIHEEKIKEVSCKRRMHKKL